MALELEHAIGGNVSFRNTSHLCPNGQEYAKAVGGVVIVGLLSDPHQQEFLRGHDDFITCVAVTKNGLFCASGQQGKNADVILWDLASKQQIFCFQEQDHGIDCLCFSHDDRLLICCGDAVDGRLFVYDVMDRLIIAHASLVPKPTICIVAGGFVRDIKRRDTHEYQFASCGGKSVSMWHLDAQRGEIVAHPVNASGKHQRDFVCLAFAPDFEYFVAGTTTGDFAVVLMKNRVIQTYIQCCHAGVMNVTFLPTVGGSNLVAGGGDGTMTLMGGATPVELRPERQINLDGPVTGLSLSSDGSEVLAVSSVGSSFLVRCKDLSLRLQSQVSPGALYDVAYPAGISDMFLTCCGDGSVTLWNMNDYTATIRCPTSTRAHPMSAAASEDILATGCSDGRLIAFDCMHGQKLWHIDNAHRGGVPCVKLASNVRFVASGGAEGDIRIWELKTREMASHLKEHGSRITDLGLFPNDQYLISCSRDRCLLTWDLRSERRLTAHREIHGGINCLAVCSNQTTVITAGQEKTLTYWDLRMADPVRVRELDEEALSVGLSPDNRWLVTAGTGQVVKIWDVAAAEVVSSCLGHSRTIQKVAFSPDGKQIVSVGLDQAAMVWNLYT